MGSSSSPSRLRKPTEWSSGERATSSDSSSSSASEAGSAFTSFSSSMAAGAHAAMTGWLRQGFKTAESSATATAEPPVPMGPNSGEPHAGSVTVASTLTVATEASDLSE